MASPVSSNKVKFDTLRSLDFSSISAVAFSAIGAAFSNPVRLLKITNLTDVDLLISFNGIDSNDIIAAYGFSLYDYSSNRAAPGGFLEQSIGESVYAQAKSTLPTSGAVYITAMYASQK